MRPAALLSVVALAGVLSSCAVGVRLPASAVGGDVATLNGKVLSTSGGPGSWFFEYAELPDSDLQVAERTPARDIDFVVNESHPVSEPVEGLSPGRAYYFRPCAEDSENPGDPFCSPFQSFRTDGDSVQGAVVTETLGELEQGYTFEVGSGPAGENVSGYVFGRAFNGRTIIGVPLCLAVNGNAAVIGIDWTDPGFGSEYRVVEDGDRAGPDRTGSMASATPNACSSFAEDVPLADVLDGDLVVEDAQPPPN